jgi:undecaprenyl-diphosphatase
MYTPKFTMAKGNGPNGLRSPGLLGKRPLIGYTIAVFGFLVFAILAYNLVMHGLLIQWDLPVAESFHALALNSSPLVINIMIASFYLGKQGIVVIAILLGLYFIYKRYWRELVMVIAGFGLAGLSFAILSKLFNRPRPTLLLDKQIWVGPTIPGFPSGHTISMIVCFGLLAYLLVPRIKSILGKALAILITMLIILFVGYSRLYLGDHYLTDVIGGYALGFAWFGFAYTTVELLFLRHRQREEKRKFDHEKATKNPERD